MPDNIQLIRLYHYKYIRASKTFYLRLNQALVKLL